MQTAATLRQALAIVAFSEAMWAGVCKVVKESTHAATGEDLPPVCCIPQGVSCEPPSVSSIEPHLQDLRVVQPAHPRHPLANLPPSPPTPHHTCSALDCLRLQRLPCSPPGCGLSRTRCSHCPTCLPSLPLQVSPAFTSSSSDRHSMMPPLPRSPQLQLRCRTAPVQSPQPQQGQGLQLVHHRMMALPQYRIVHGITLQCRTVWRGCGCSKQMWCSTPP